MSALRRRQLVALVEEHECEACGGSKASLALVLEALEQAGWKIPQAKGDSTEDERGRMAWLFDRDKGARALVERAHGSGWCLIARTDGTLVLLTSTKRYARRDIARRIVREANAGKGVRAIARDLQAEGIPTARGGRWSHQTVSGILARERSRTR